METQTIQELEIIIKAQVEEARKEIKSFLGEAKEMVKSFSNEINNSFSSGQFIGFKKEMDVVRNSVKKIKNEFNKGIGVNVDPTKKELQKLNAELLEAKQKMLNISQLGGSKIELNNMKDKIAQLTSEIDKLENSVSKTTLPFEKFRDIAAKLEEEGLNPHEVLSFRDSFKLLCDQIVNTIPVLGNFKQAVKENLNGEYGDKTALMWFRDIGIKAKETASNIKDTFQSKIGSIKNYFSDIGSSISSRLAPITSIFSNIGSFAKVNFNKVKHTIGQCADSIGTPLNKLKTLISKIRGVGTETDKSKKKMSSFGSNIGKSFKSAIKSIKKFTLSLLSVRTAFTVVSKAAQAYLSFDTQLNDSIQNSWNVLGSLLAPILEYVANLFSKLVSAVATFVKALTGIDLVAKANAKALDKQAKSAQSASKSLAGIDDIDVLSTSSSSSDETSKITIEDVDVSPLTAFANKVKDIFSKLFNPFKESWENVGTDVFDSMKSMIGNLGELCSSVFTSFVDVWSNGTGEEIITNFLLIFEQVFDIIGGISEALTTAWNNAGTGTSIIQSIANIFKDIQKFTLSVGESIQKWVVSDSFQEALNKVLGFVDDIFSYVEEICDWVLEMYDTYLKPVIEEKLLPAIDSIIIAVMDIWEAIKPVVDFCIDCIKTTLEPAIDGLCEFIGGIIDVVKGIADFISGIFTGDWKKAWEGIKTIFKGLWDSMASLIKTPINIMLTGIEWLVNKIISGFNSFKKALNKISFDIPDWIPIIGGKKWGFNLKMSDEVTLPRLAKGDVAYEPIVAQIGEYANARNNPEIVSPVSIMADTFRNVLSEFDFGGTRIDTLKIDVAGDNFYQGAVDYINSENTRKGVNIIKEMV